MTQHLQAGVGFPGIRAAINKEMRLMQKHGGKRRMPHIRERQPRAHRLLAHQQLTHRSVELAGVRCIDLFYQSSALFERFDHLRHNGVGDHIVREDLLRRLIHG